MFDEIRKLSDENKELKEAISELEKRSASESSKKTESFKELREILSEIDIKVPADLANGEETTVDLLSIFYGSRDTLINGVTNQSGSSAAQSFFFFNVCPKLQVHGLVVNEKVAGVRYRRYAVTQLGSAFLADMEKRIILGKKNKEAEPSPSEVPAKTPAKKVPAKKLPKTK